MTWNAQNHFCTFLTSALQLYGYAAIIRIWVFKFNSTSNKFFNFFSKSIPTYWCVDATGYNRLLR